MLLGTSAAWADEVTFTAGTDKSDNLTITKDGVTMTLSSGTLSRTDNYRVYAKATLTVSVESGASITEIEFTSTSIKGGTNGPDQLSTTTGTYTTTDNSKVSTWTGSAESVVLTASTQYRATSIKVTYTPKAVTTTTTTLELDKSTMSLVVGNTGTLKATLKDYQEAEITGQTITYSSSDEDIATVDENGTVTAKAAGEATITASFAGVTDTYDAADAECVVTVNRAAVLGELVFNNANDAFASISSVTSYNPTSSGATYSFTADNGESYDFKLTNVMAKKENDQVSMQLKASVGKVETPTFGFPDGYTAIISFKTAKTITINDQSFDGTDGSFVTATITETTDKAITIEAGSKVVYVSKIEIIPNTPTYTLNDETSTLSDIEDVESGKNVKFNRTITTGWNAICLPFAVSADDLKTIFGDEAEVGELTSSELVGTTQKLNFSRATSITAGKPCLVYSENELSHFTLAGVGAATTSVSEEATGNCTMKGTLVYADEAINVDDIYMASGTLYFAEQAWAIKGFRSWVKVNEAGARNIEIVMDGTTTDISAATLGIESDDETYDLSGRKIESPMKKGIYVINGKKMVIK